VGFGGIRIEDAQEEPIEKEKTGLEGVNIDNHVRRFFADAA